ncbi:Uncharacterised protein [Metamycoplasma cloacale]|uniref:Uncharacterized protein n=1 Tax=Metamycoplasma cloacale TaxID=92401 RepID=A0A2Z4LLT0_9BACT|nr:hypothetical protein [Metamycoplasma cloacale]AWX42669.1 hypothetical protein DK849_01080 [Metamycoplasma cloacale]VEU79519.1 Uncharacterised protein [Metamycoplasma cloacale]
MICTRLLMLIPNHTDYNVFPLMRTTEYTIYIKVSNVQHDNEIKACELTKLSSYDIEKKYDELYLIDNEFFITENKIYDKFVSDKLVWNYGNESLNYHNSALQKHLLEILLSHLTGENQSYSLIAMLDSAKGPEPMHIYCDKQLAYDEMTKVLKEDGGKLKFSTIQASNVLDNTIPIVLENMELGTTKHYLSNILGAFVIKAIEYIKEKQEK